jgi:iron complex outermembrane receptor protein
MSVRIQNGLSAVGVAVATILACAGSPAFAQTATSAASEKLAGLEEITVTARRREESLQEVPISVVAITGDQLVQRGFETQESFNRMVPNVVIHGSNGFFGRQEGSFQMRGIGQVSILYDGIAHPETFGIVQSNITEVDHVEVLRGPQGTLFGKEAMGGVIQYVTVKPSDTAGVRGKVSFGARNRADVQVVADVPITDTLLTKFSVGKFSRDGYMRSYTTGNLLGSQSDTLADADILWKPTDKFSWRVGLSYANNTNNGNPIQNYAVFTGTPGVANPCAVVHPNPIPLAALNLVGAGLRAPDFTCLYNQIGLTIPASNAYGAAEKYATDSDYNGPQLYTTIRGISSNMTYVLNDKLTAKWLTGYRTVKNFDYTDFDGTRYRIFEGKNYNEQDEGTTELQVQYTGEKLIGTTGVYGYLDYQRAHRMNWFTNDLRLAVNPANNAAAVAWLRGHTNPFVGLVVGGAPVLSGTNCLAGVLNCYATVADAAGGPVAVGGGNVDALTWNYSKGHAFFTEWTYKVTDALSATAGVRLNKDHIYNRSFAPKYTLPLLCCEPIPSIETNGAGPISAPVESDFSNTSPKASLQYQWNPDLMTYVSYTEGFNRGGASITRATATVPSQLIPVNPETVKNYEVGVRSDWFDHRLRVNATYFYARQIGIKLNQDLGGINVVRNAGEAVTKGLEFDGYWAITDQLLFNFAGGTDSAKLTKLNPGVSTANFNVGQTLNYAPKKSISGGLSYNIPLESGAAFNVRGDYGWQSEQWTTNDLTNRALIPSFGLMNARIGYTAPESKYEIALSGTNILNKFYRINGYLVPNVFNDVGTPGRPAEWALTLSTKF